jgi:hypothetical protein
VRRDPRDVTAPARAALDRRVLDWIRACDASGDLTPDDARFDALARDLFRHQLAACPPYARFCAARGVDPGGVGSWREIPAVPAGAFKELALRSFPAEREVHVFRTSGTAGERRGELHLDTLALYEASVVPSFRGFVLPDVERARPVRLRILAPPAAEAPDSSLSHMFGVLLRELAARGLVDAARSGFDVAGGALQIDGLVDALHAARADGAPVALCGAAFAFVHLLDALAARGLRLALPAGSRVFETGGFKGRSRELPQGALYAALEEALGVPAARIVNQYGMTELASQFHDSVLRFPGTPRRKLGPPWARARIVDPATGRECAPGAPGLVEIVDLANTGSVLAIQTADLGRSAGDGFEVLGREPGAEARGCSIAADVMLGGRAW